MDTDTATDMQADVERRALLAAHADRHTPGTKVVLPNGVRRLASRYIHAKHPGDDKTLMLGDPSSLLKNPKPGYAYVWRKRDDPATGGLIRSRQMRPLELSEINPDSSAPLTDFVCGTGAYVIWENMALFEMPPAVFAARYTAYEDWAAGQLARGAEQFSETVSGETGGGYAGTVKVEA